MLSELCCIALLFTFAVTNSQFQSSNNKIQLAKLFRGRKAKDELFHGEKRAKQRELKKFN